MSRKRDRPPIARPGIREGSYEQRYHDMIRLRGEANPSLLPEVITVLRSQSGEVVVAAPVITAQAVLGILFNGALMIGMIGVAGMLAMWLTRVILGAVGLETVANFIWMLVLGTGVGVSVLDVYWSVRGAFPRGHLLAVPLATFVGLGAAALLAHWYWGGEYPDRWQLWVRYAVSLEWSMVAVMLAMMAVFETLTTGSFELLDKEKVARSAFIRHGRAAIEELSALLLEEMRGRGIPFESLMCSQCLTRLTLEREPMLGVSYPRCRACGRVLCREGNWTVAGEVVAALWQDQGQERFRRDDRLYINWSRRRSLFDFDAVEIVRADDAEIERFVMQASGDTDERRRGHVKEMICRIRPECTISSHTEHMLKHTFGAVERLPANRKASSREVE